MERASSLNAARGPEERAGAPGNFRIRASEAGKWVLLLLIRFYIVCLSPLFGGACKFYPSCSNYAWEAIGRHGARRGAVLALKRLLRCHPLGGHGLDPVPEHFGLRRAGSGASAHSPTR